MGLTSRVTLRAGVAAIMWACGGESNGGVGAVGGSNTGGSSVTGGSSTGGTISIAGQGGGAGAIPLGDLPPCLQPADPGSCTGAFARYAFDPEAVACKPFTYGGCDGTDNNFETLEACNAACVVALPAGCNDSPRATGCPCTAAASCSGVCAVPGVGGDRCAPAPAGYCVGVSERCSCRIDGELVCGA